MSAKAGIFNIATTFRGEESIIPTYGKIIGAWAAHEAINAAAGYRVTFLRFGTACPYDFPTFAHATRAAKELNALRDWSDVSLDDIKGMAADLAPICIKHMGERLNGPTARLDMAPMGAA